jgi:hypothetical protein
MGETRKKFDQDFREGADDRSRGWGQASRYRTGIAARWWAVRLASM